MAFVLGDWFVLNTSRNDAQLSFIEHCGGIPEFNT
jgi:hypothetical protein